jgi:hypothetical protein
MSAEPAIRPKDEPVSEELARCHPGLIRFAEEMRRNHPEISEQEIRALFEAWSR